MHYPILPGSRQNTRGNHSTGTDVAVHKRIPGWKLTKSSDRREALVQSLLAAATDGDGDGDGEHAYSKPRPATTINHSNNDRIVAPGRLLGVGVGMDTQPSPSRSHYNSRASPTPSPPRPVTTYNNHNNNNNNNNNNSHNNNHSSGLVRAPYAGHPMAGVPLVASNALVIGLPAGN